MSYLYHNHLTPVNNRHTTDNALDPSVRHLSTYPHQKHLPSDVIASDHPRLSDVLEEISLYIST